MVQRHLLDLYSSERLLSGRKVPCCFAIPGFSLSIRISALWRQHSSILASFVDLGWQTDIEQLARTRADGKQGARRGLSRFLAKAWLLLAAPLQGFVDFCKLLRQSLLALLGDWVVVSIGRVVSAERVDRGVEGVERCRSIDVVVPSISCYKVVHFLSHIGNDVAHPGSSLLKAAHVYHVIQHVLGICGRDQKTAQEKLQWVRKKA
mmetsp:Transcript_16484/g.67780  ORF Transcript_16484/g.67780 Transcript_16484/m.67780 type:complete len:206 (-) Transcript_16484:352-969(-)